MRKAVILNSFIPFRIRVYEKTGVRLVIVNQMRVPKTASDRPRLGDYKLAYKCSLGGHGFSRAENASERGLQPLKNRGISEALIYETALGRVGGSVWESNPHSTR